MTDKEKFEYIAHLYYNLVTGGDDNIDEAMDFLHDEKLLDEDGDWIYGDEENE